MKKMISLIKACMTSDMSIFKISTKKNSRAKLLVPLLLAGYLMIYMFFMAYSAYEGMSETHFQYVLLSLFAVGVSMMTLIEGIYKAGPLMFNCKDDQLLLSLPIERRTVLFVRIFKFYVFELLFNSIFLLPTMAAYVPWAENLSWTYFLVCFFALFLIPVVPIVVSCFIGAVTTSLSSISKYKNALQIILSMIFIFGVFAVSFNLNRIFEYVMQHATSINDMISKLYYPAGAYASLAHDFKVLDFIIYVVLHVGVFVASIYILSLFYFKINSKAKRVITSSKHSENKELIIKSSSQKGAIIKKELTTLFKTPVLIVNAGFSLVLFLLLVGLIVFKTNSIIDIAVSEEAELGLTKELIMNSIPLVILALSIFTVLMTSITSSLVSLEGKSINILKSLPVSSKTILLGKVLAAFVITTPVLVIGDLILLIKFNIGIITSILLILAVIAMSLVTHMVGIIANVAYPKLDWENESQVVKQSASVMVATLAGLGMAVAIVSFVFNVTQFMNADLIIGILLLFAIILDIILYLILVKKSAKAFDKLSA